MGSFRGMKIYSTELKFLLNTKLSNISVRRLRMRAVLLFFCVPILIIILMFTYRMMVHVVGCGLWEGWELCVVVVVVGKSDDWKRECFQKDDVIK